MLGIRRNRQSPRKARSGQARSGRKFWPFTLMLVAVLSLRAFVAEAYVIPSGSMEPTLQVGDRVLVHKGAFGVRVPFTHRWMLRWSQPTRGDVVIFSDPRGSGETLIKRVVALSGDRVAVRDNQIVINGVAVPRLSLGVCPQRNSCRLLAEQLGSHHYRVQQLVLPLDSPERRVPAGHIFVMGDNRDDSSDSRIFGAVPLTHVRGRALLVLWSMGEGPRLERFGTPLL